MPRKKKPTQDSFAEIAENVVKQIDEVVADVTARVEELMPPPPLTEAQLDAWAAENPLRTREQLIAEGLLTPMRTEPGFRSVPVRGARELVTVGPEHPWWRDDGITVPTDWKGAIVRLRPPEDADDVRVDGVVAFLTAAGASAVRLERRRGKKVVDAPVERKPHARARDVVLSLTQQANVRDRERFAAFVDGVMGRAGL
jgi:hypothetical protein